MDMPERSSRKDSNTLAFGIVQQVTGQKPQEKDPAAVALGRKGGLKGGKTRAEKLSAEKRQEIARRAANSRWGVK